MLNAGPVADISRDAERLPASDLPYRGFRPPGRLEHVAQANEFNANVWVDEQEVPYTIEPDQPYSWVRVRLFGGRSLFWSRQSFRLSDYEFKCKSHDGFGEDWPISHADLAPYYSRVERIFRVAGALDGPPQMPDGAFILDDDPWTPSMQRFINAASPRTIPVCKQRRALGVNGLASSVNLLLPDAEKTGNLKSIANAVVREITVDKNTGLPNGCNFVDRISRREMSVKARVVVLAAGTLESTRLLLNSGLANSSGVLGRYLTDQIYGAGVVASVPEARNRKGEKIMGGSAIVPRFRNIDTRSDKFLRGYAFNVTSMTGALGARNFAAYGAELEKKLEEYYGSGFVMTIMGEVLGRYENHVASIKKRWTRGAFPCCMSTRNTLTTNTTWRKMPWMWARELCEAAGFEVLSKNDSSQSAGLQHSRDRNLPHGRRLRRKAC